MSPAQIDPESGCRIPLPRREDLDPEGKQVHKASRQASTAASSARSGASTQATQHPAETTDFAGPRELGVGAVSERPCQEPRSHTVIRIGIINDARL
jgi:hypothetical protein